MKDYLKRFHRDEGGHYAIMTAILGLPLIIGVSAAMDFTSAQSEYTSVKNALDNAVLAAATNNKISLSEKEKFATLHFKQNYSGRANITTTADAKGDVVTMTANGMVPFSVSEALGVEGVEIGVRSAAKRSEENVICVLALAESGSESIKFSGGLNFYAPTCSVHSNSTDGSAIVSNGNSAPIAKSFCTTGGVKGSFSPFAKGQCLQVSDPYENVPGATVSTCVSETKFKAPKNPKDQTGESANATGDNITLYPGTYCKGLTVDGVNVRFMPGDYVIMDGSLTFKNGAQAEGQDVTFGLKGDKATLKIEKGADLTIRAPKSGPRKGLAFMEIDPEQNKQSKGKGKGPNKPIEIKSGGRLNVIGTIYFPTKQIKVTGSGTQMGSHAPATSFIANTIHLDGESNSRVEVKVDHKKANLPPIMPRAEDGAMLIE